MKKEQHDRIKTHWQEIESLTSSWPSPLREDTLQAVQDALRAYQAQERRAATARAQRTADIDGPFWELHDALPPQGTLSNRVQIMQQRFASHGLESPSSDALSARLKIVGGCAIRTPNTTYSTSAKSS